MKKLFKWMLIMTAMGYVYLVSTVSYFYFEDIMEDYFLSMNWLADERTM
mgnify:FL=1